MTYKCKDLEMIKTKKVGVYYNLLENDDKVFYFNYKNLADNKLIWVKVGRYSEVYFKDKAIGKDRIAKYIKSWKSQSNSKRN